MHSCLKRQANWLSGLLVILILFVAGIQCCHLMLAQPANATPLQTEQSMNCHQTAGSEEHSPDSKACHCETNPGQLAYFSDYALDDFSHLLNEANILRSISPALHESTFMPERFTLIRPPPLLLSIHIPSTVLLI